MEKTLRTAIKMVAENKSNYIIKDIENIVKKITDTAEKFSKVIDKTDIVYKSSRLLTQKYQPMLEVEIESKDMESKALRAFFKKEGFNIYGIETELKNKYIVYVIVK